MGPQKEATDYAAEPVSRGNLRQQVTLRLMTGIFQGRFRSGQRLVVQGLASAYRASPTPVREALVELASLGLVDLLPNRGAVVQPFGPQEIREISQIRRLLEVEATSCACGRIPDDELSALEREFLQLEVLPHDQAWDQRARAADTKLHGLVAACCGSRRLAAEIGRYLALFRAVRRVSSARCLDELLAIERRPRTSGDRRGPARTGRHRRGPGHGPAYPIGRDQTGGGGVLRSGYPRGGREGGRDPGGSSDDCRLTSSIGSACGATASAHPGLRAESMRVGSFACSGAGGHTEVASRITRGPSRSAFRPAPARAGFIRACPRRNALFSLHLPPKGGSCPWEIVVRSP